MDAETDDETPQLDARAVHELFSGWDKQVPSVDEMRQWFADDLVFEDPLQRTEGIAEYREMNERLLKKNQDLVIAMEESAQNGRHIMFTFSLELAPSRKRPNLRIYNSGMTYVRLNDDGKIEYHRDVWDLNTMFLSAAPARVRNAYRKFVKRFG